MESKNTSTTLKKSDVLDLINSSQTLDILNAMFFVIDDQLNVIYYNKMSENVIQKEILNQFKILRPGNMFNCQLGAKGEKTCTTTGIKCDKCSLQNAISRALVSKKQVDSEIFIYGKNNRVMVCNIRVTPFERKERTILLLCATDITYEHRIKSIGHHFLHDLADLAGSLTSYLDVVSSLPADKLAGHLPNIKPIADQLYDQINYQRQVSKIEENDFDLDIQEINIFSLLDHIKVMGSKQPCAAIKKLHIKYPTKDFTFSTDLQILERVIINLLKNASESSQKGSSYTFSARKEDDRVIFSVHNESVIPANIQHEIFNFSKNSSKYHYGMGTYVIRLFTESALQGKAWFTSNEEDKTTFYISIPLVLVDNQD